MDAPNLYGHSLIQVLPYDEIEMWHGHPDLYMNKLEEILNTPDDSDIEYFLEVGLRYPDDIKEKTKMFPFCPEKKVVHKDKYNDYMKKIKPKNYTKAKKLLCDWTDKKKFHLNRVSGWRNIKFNTQKQNKAKNDFERGFYKSLNNAFYRKKTENVRNRLKSKFFKKDDIKITIKQQSKLTFNGIHESYEKYVNYSFKQNEFLMDKPIYLGFPVLQLSKLHMYDLYYDKLQTYVGQESLQFFYIDTDSFILSVNTKNIIRDIKNLEDKFDCSNLDKNLELFSNKK